MRDIINTAATSIFYGRHSTYGLIAVKCLRQKPAVLGPTVHTFAQYWENEKRLLQNVDHPSIIKFVGADARFFSIYMEYLPYPDLTGMMSRPGYMFTGTTDDATRVLRDMASALEHLAVERKLLHNDIKPGNILYDPARGAVLVDFGLGSSESEKICKGGTPWYVPREFMIEGKRGFESDIFALGVTLLYLLNKTPLPELHCNGWIIARVARDDLERSRMERWLQEVAQMRSQLADDVIELLVKQMIDEDLEHRISAASLVRRTQNLARN
ncbi:hypothetical protein EsDP_00006238 [Epichloe bromicola]|uniref:Protein kinase domain-containing protein n=1 Tax=Epichloe bromicola TaxID=79588 RepID=A0ABQ0CX16_9HYPO